jgi:general secretion pathway protein G
MNRKPLPASVRSAQAGFTLVEIMVVIVILGLLATLVVQNVAGASDEARETKARTDVKVIADAVRSYYAKKGSMPESLDVLAQKDDRGRSEIEELPLDPWQHAYEMREGNTRHDWEVISLGPDGVASEDDISSKSKKDEK